MQIPLKKFVEVVEFYGLGDQWSVETTGWIQSGACEVLTLVIVSQEHEGVVTRTVVIRTEDLEQEDIPEERMLKEQALLEYLDTKLEEASTYRIPHPGAREVN